MPTFACPSCRKQSDWPDDWMGEKVDCPSCHRLMKLARPPRDDEDEDWRESSSRRRSRDEDDDDRDRREISSRRRSRDDEDDFDRDDRSGRGRITCLGCDYRGRPDIVNEMSSTSWIFILIGILFWPLIIIGVLMKDTWEVCPECGRKIRKTGSTFGG